MEVRGRNGSIELPTPNPSKPEGIVALRHFTIPRKQWMSGQVHLEACTEDSRDYALIQSKLRESRLDMRKEHANTWLWKDVKLVHNDGLLREFSEKRSEMRANGRHGREMEEHFGFLLASYEATNQIYQFGLRTGSQEQYSLGKPSHGVYLFKHVDVALKHATAGTGSGKNLIVFKVLFGKVKKVTASLEWNKTVDPTVSFDCHMAKDAVSYRDSVSQQVLGSSVFLFDYNQNQELAKRPRQCLPYAVVSFAPAGSAAASISPPASPTKPPAGHMQGTLENLKGCTVAKRTGKGENTTITFKRFAHQGCPSVEYQSQTPGAEPNGVDTTAFQYNDLQTSPLFIPQQAYMPYYDTAEFFSPSLPYYDSGISWQSYGNKSEFPLNLHNWSATGVYGCNTETMELIPQTSAERISTIVYSSRLVKDPRLSRQETNIQTESSEEERASSANCTEEQACQAHSQGRKEENESTLSCEEQSVELDKEHKEERFPDPSLDDASKTNSTAQPKTENMPSIKLFKMKFQKYAPYFKMTEEERHRKIWSKGNLTVEQKQLLIDRIHFYEMHHQKYKQGLLFPKDTEPEPAFSLSHTYSQNNDVCSSTHPLILEKANRCEANQSQRAGVSSLTPTTVLDDSGRNKVDILSTDIDEKLKQRVCRPKENHVQDAEQDCSLDSQTEPQGGGMVQSVREKERMSQTFVGQGNVQSNPSGRSKLSDSADIFFAQSICPSLQVNNQDVENEISTCPKEYCACTPTLCNAIEDCSKSEPHITMEVANCVDVSATVLDCNFCPYATAMESGQHSQSSTDKQHREPLTYFKSTSNSEMSIEVEMEKVQQQNTVYNSLYERLQLDQLLSNSNGANDLSNKPYLRPKGLDKMPATDPPDSHVNEPKEEDLQLIVKLKSGQTFPERLMLSERFSNLRHFGRKLAAFIRVHRLTNSYTTGPNGDLKCEPKAQMYCSDGEKGTENNNAMLIKLMAQRYNENLFKANCKRLRQKSTKFRCQKSSSVLSRRTSGLIRFQTQTKHLRKNHLLKAKKKFTNLALKVSSRGLTSFSKSTSDLSNDLCCTGTANHVDKSSESYLSSTSATQSQPGSQVYGELLNEKSGENDHTINISTEEGSRVDSDNQTRHDEELSETKGQYIHLAKQSIESVCRDVLKISNLNEFKESEENITLDPNDLEEMKLDSKTNNSKTRHQEKSSMVSCSDSNESSNGENAGTKPKEAAILTKKLSQRNNSDTKKISPEYNTGAYEDTSSPVYTVSSIPSAITPENLISSSTTTAHTALTPDSPEVMNNRANTPTKSGKLGVNAVDNSASGLPQRISNTNKSGGTNKICNPKDRELYNNPESTDANETCKKSDADPNCLKALKSVKVGVAEKAIHLSAVVSGSQCQPSLQDTRSSGMVNALVETTSDFRSRIIRDAQKDLAGSRNNLHLAWQGQDKNSLPTTTDTQIISKLRDYLTRFEFTVKKQDCADNLITEDHVPMAWITLDSTAQKQILHKARHYNKKGLADVTHRQGDTVPFQLAYNELNKSEEGSQPSSPVAKRRRASVLERVSPDSTITETVRNEPNSNLGNEDNQPYHTGVANTNHWLQNHGNNLQENQTISSQLFENLTRSSGQQGNGSKEQQIYGTNEQSTCEQVHTTCTQTRYSVTDISNTLKLADRAVSVTELGPLRSKCKRMLQHFISNFEKDQEVSFTQSCITRNAIMEKYLRHPPPAMELKFEAINSFLELQMIIEACQFVDNKINFLRRKPTFRSLLWYDPSLYGELYKGAVGFQQQSSLFSTFQQCLSGDDYKRLQEYYCAVSTLHQQLQDAPDTSYYMYLKTKRERLELEAAFRNPADVKNFFLSVPTAIMINLGDHLEVLKKTYNIVMTFIETPADRLPGTFDVGKAEHLSIICRYLHEKILYLKFRREMAKISWFGMEHLLYDASKILVWSESEYGMPNEVLRKYKRLSSQIVYGMTEDCVALVNKTDQSSQLVESVKITAPQQRSAIRIPPAEVAPEKTQPALNIQKEDRKKETHQPPGGRAMNPFFSDGTSAFVQPSLAAQPGSTPLYNDFTQRSNVLHWRNSRDSTWDWSPPDAIQSTSHSEMRALLLSERIPTAHTIPGSTSLPDVQNSHGVRQQQVSKPLIVKPRPVDRNKAPPAISAPKPLKLLKEQATDFGMPMMPPFSFPSFSMDAPSVIPPPLPPLPFSSTSNQVALHNNPTQISYPFFVFNGQTYSTAGSSVPVSAIHTDTQYLPRPV